MAQHRIFIAINLPREAMDVFREYQNKWYDLPAQWTKRENLHITLVFIGYINSDEMLDICGVVKQAVKHFESFRVSFKKIIFAPPNQLPRMIWAEGENSGEISALQAKLESGIFHSGGAFGNKETRVFRPHITIARIRQGAWKNIEEVPNIEEKIDLSFNVNSIEVMESRLEKGGVEYVALESVDFGN